jgi:endonuclease/exonuclease/phosphatase family metal-dependent hydrolase
MNYALSYTTSIYPIIPNSVFFVLINPKISTIMCYSCIEDRRDDFLSELAETCSKIKIPLIGGDFNILRFSNEKNKNFVCNRYTDMFNWIINTHELRDLPLIGGMYTWSNNHKEPTLERLDRVLISPEWETCFPSTNLNKNPRVMSDHNPLILR